jgi:flap endonuclease-1
MAQFIDLCIVLGSDYTDTKTIPGVGPKTGLKLIKKHKSVEAIIAAEGYEVGPGFTYAEARAEFLAPATRDVAVVDWVVSPADITSLEEFLTASGLDKRRYCKGIDTLKGLCK